MMACKRCIRWSFTIILGLALAPVLCLPAITRGELLSDDTNAMDGWHGTKNYTSSNGKLVAEIRYAVYSPGNFNLSFDGQDPSANTQYVYAYQLYNTEDTMSNISYFSVGLDGNESAANDGYIEDPYNSSAIQPSAHQIAGTSFVCYFDAPYNIPMLGESKILLFTSPCVPEWDSASLKGVSAPATGSVSGGLPSPLYTSAPEPAAFLSLIIAGVMLFWFRVSRGRKWS